MSAGILSSENKKAAKEENQTINADKACLAGFLNRCSCLSRSGSKAVLLSLVKVLSLHVLSER